MNPDFQFDASFRDYHRYLDVLVYTKDQATGDRIAVVPFTELAVKRSDGPVTRPTFELHPRAAQRLMDALYAAGVRPTALRGDPSPEVLRAKDAHLQDVRALLQHHLGAPVLPVGG